MPGRGQTPVAPIRVYQAQAEQLPFPDGFFDCVLSCLVLCSVSDQRTVLAEIQRVLHRRGTLVLLEHVLPTARGLAWLAHRITPVWSARLHNCHPNRDTLGMLVREGWRAAFLRRRACIIRGVFTPAGPEAR